MNINLVTKSGKRTTVEMPILPRVGEELQVCEMAELYEGQDYQSPLWTIQRVVYDCAFASTAINSFNTCDGVTLYIKNEEED